MFRISKDTYNTIVLTEEERQAHPIASKIPKPIWDACHVLGSSWTHGMYAIELELMQLPLEAILSDQAYTDGLFELPPDKSTAWLCIAVAHPEATTEQLCLIAERLGIMPNVRDNYPDGSLFRMAAGLGYLPLLQHILAIINPESRNGIIRGRYQIENYRLAAICGQTDVLRYMESVYTESNVDLFYSISTGTVFLYAALQEHFATCQYLLSKAFIFNIVDSHERRTLESCQENHLTPFILSKINELKLEQAIARNNMLQVYDLTDTNQIEICLVMLRNMARLNDRAMDCHFKFLLDIPAVKSALISGKFISCNALLTEAITCRNVITILLLCCHIPELSSLDLSNQNLYDDDFQVLAEDLSACTQLTNINLSYNKLSDNSARLLAAMSHLNMLDVSHNIIGETGLVLLVACEHLHQLHIKGNINPQHTEMLNAITDPIDKVNLAINHKLDYALPSLRTLSLYVCKKRKIDVSSLDTELQAEVERQRI